MVILSAIATINVLKEKNQIYYLKHIKATPLDQSDVQVLYLFS